MLNTTLSSKQSHFRPLKTHILHSFLGIHIILLIEVSIICLSVNIYVSNLLDTQALYYMTQVM